MVISHFVVIKDFEYEGEWYAVGQNLYKSVNGLYGKPVEEIERYRIPKEFLEKNTNFVKEYKVENGIKPIVIDLPLPELLKERNFRKKYYDLTLHPEYLEVRCNYKSELDSSDGDIPEWTENLHLFNYTIEKNAIKHIGYSWVQKADVFCLEIDAMGAADTEHFYFKGKKECEEAYRIIHEWRFPKN